LEVLNIQIGNLRWLRSGDSSILHPHSVNERQILRLQWDVVLQNRNKTDNNYVYLHRVPQLSRNNVAPFLKMLQVQYILIIDVVPAKEKCSKSTWTKNWLGPNSTPACNTPNASARFSSACSTSPECLFCFILIFWVSCSPTGRKSISFALITLNQSSSMNKSTTVCYFLF
jgi:hypothetical protein